ncbi:MAG TPA: trypsin-like peptidase domain-containing protein [Blastocatellia bacterium]|nr:trypsin-like peptidase domain-containing protein [Blastocatellia bacterium]
MRIIISTTLLAIFIHVSVFAQNQALKSPSEIAREQSKAVVIIEALDERGSVTGQGSGFIVTPQGAVVTNLHVVQGAASLRVKLPGGDAYKTSDLVDVDDVKDIAIVKIKGFKLPVVTLGDSDKAETGEAVVAISSPEGLVNSISTGVISGVRRFDTHRVFQISAPISQGSSGGALFNSGGEVIGVITYLLKSGQNINFAVPINYARGMIGDQPSKTLADLRPLKKSNAGSEPGASLTESVESGERLDGQLSGAMRGKLGRTRMEPMFARPDEALKLFFRLVEGVNLINAAEVAQLTRSAAVIKSKETDDAEEYKIDYLTSYSGLAMTFSRPEHLLTGVELLVNWSVVDLENTFGDKYKKRTVGKEKVLDYGKLETGNKMVATLDGNGNVRSVKFVKAK